MRGMEHDEAISIYALQMQARRLLRRHYPSPPFSALTPRNDNSEVFQQSHAQGSGPHTLGLSELVCNRPATIFAESARGDFDARR